jgi:molecular chaperone HtpG
LYLNEASQEFAQEYRIRSLIKQHSNYVIYPIMMKESVDKEDPSKIREYQQINDGIALWNKAKSQITAEQLKEFYQSLSYDMSDPLDHIHLNIE